MGAVRTILAAFLLFSVLNPRFCTCAETAPESTAVAEVLSSALETPAKPWAVDVSRGMASRTVTPQALAWDLSAYQRLSIRAFRQQAGAASVRLRWVIESRVGGLYTTTQASPAGAGATVTVAAILNPEETDLIPEGHVRPWDALAAAEITSIELRAECYGAKQASGEVAEITLSHALLEHDYSGNAHGPMLSDLSVETAPPVYNAAAALRFRIDPTPADPFAATGNSDVRVLLPDGKQALAFYDQEYTAINDGRSQRRLPIGRPFWRAYLPTWPDHGAIAISGAGRHWEFAIEKLGAPHASHARPGAGETATRWQSPLVETLHADDLGWGDAPRFWTLTSGGSWQPAPHASKAFSGEAWRPVLFWNSNWGNYGGAARPDLAVAQDMDAELERAAQAHTARPLIVLDGESLERNGVFNWDTHPLNGVLKAPGDVFVSDEGVEFCRRSMRYAIARWGLSKAVSELLLTPRLTHPAAPLFHAKLASSLAVWPLPPLPVRTFNPLACEPAGVCMLGSFEPHDTPKLTRWSADPLTSAAETKVVLAGNDGRSCMAIAARDPRTTALSLLNTYRVRGGLVTQEPNLAHADSILFDVWIPADAAPDLRVGVHLRDRDGIWFETLLPGMVRPGDWTTYALDVTGGNSQQLNAVDSKKLWTEYSRQRVTELGLHVFSVHSSWTPPNRNPLPLTARFDNIRAVAFPHGKAGAPQIACVNPTPAGLLPVPAAAKPLALTVGDLYELHLSVSKTFDNPFDPCSCDLSAVFTAPSGKRVTVPAFFDVLCQRREKNPGGEELVDPLGAEFFTVRFRPDEAGPYAAVVELREGGRYDVKESWQSDTRFTKQGEAEPAYPGGHWTATQYDRHYDGQRRVGSVSFVKGPVTAKLDLGKSAFVVNADAAKPFRGYIRVAGDKRHFEFDDGSFYYPIGPCLRSPSDTRLPYEDTKWSHDAIEKIGKRGTYQYDDYFAKFGDAGITWARIWMCSWWCALEWRGDWNGYQGFGRYNMLNAWRLDYLVKQCEAHNIRIDLGLTNHGQFTLDIDTEWKNNPYNRKLGGPLTSPCEFFTDPAAKIAHENKLRYILARYAHSPAIFAWSLCSEMEFTEEYEPSVAWNRPDAPAQNIENWVRSMASYLKANDPYQHLVTTHFSHPNRGERTLMLPEVDFATSNAYSAFDELKPADGEFDAAFALNSFWAGFNGLRGFHIFNKPALVEEQGRHWMGVDEQRGFENNSRDQLDADLHAGLWGSMVQPLAGATGYWWWLHIHFDNRYDDYKALAKFMDGEDMRPGKTEAPLETRFGAIGGASAPLVGRALRSDSRLYAWIYSPRTPLGGGDFTSSGGVMHVTKLKPGTYTVEYWDTYKGTVIESAELVVADENTRLELKIPEVHRDIALKLKPKKK